MRPVPWIVDQIQRVDTSIGGKVFAELKSRFNLSPLVPNNANDRLTVRNRRRGDSTLAILRCVGVCNLGIGMLVALGLIEPRAKVFKAVPVQPEIRTIQSIADRFTDVKRPMLAKRSVDKQEECLSVLVEYLGKDRDIASITLGEAEDFESFGKKRGFSDAHQRTHNLGYGRLG